MTQALERRSLADQIKEALIAQISSGALKPGDRLVELKIAQDMQTSQAPVREALRQLEALSLIEMRRNRGSIVRGVSAAELAHIYAVRAELEGHAAAAAAAARTAPGLGNELGKLCAIMDTALAQSDTGAFVDLNSRFHQAIVMASDNPVLIQIWERLDIRARTAANVSRDARPLQTAVREHRAIAEAIGAGDPQRARRLLEAHILAVLGDA